MPIDHRESRLKAKLHCHRTIGILSLDPARLSIYTCACMLVWRSHTPLRQTIMHMRMRSRETSTSRHLLASFPGRFCGGEEKRPGHHCWSMRVVPIKTWEFVHVCTLSAYTLVISRNISVHDYECLSVLLQLRER